MKYIHTTIYVNDLNKSLNFYNKLLGLEIVNRVEIQTQKLVFLGTGDTQVELICDGIIRDIPDTQNISMGFLCESLEESVDIFSKAGYPPITSIIKVNEFVQFVFLKDPDGYKVQLLERKN